MTEKTTHPKMSRSAYELLPESRRRARPNTDGTATIERLGPAGECYLMDVELVHDDLFPLGRVVITTALSEELDAAGIHRTWIAVLLARHSGGDWGELDEEDQLANDAAIEVGCRILSQHHLSDVRVWVITEWDRSVTTLLRPDDY